MPSHWISWEIKQHLNYLLMLLGSPLTWKKQTIHPNMTRYLMVNLNRSFCHEMHPTTTAWLRHELFSIGVANPLQVFTSEIVLTLNNIDQCVSGGYMHCLNTYSINCYSSHYINCHDVIYPIQHESSQYFFALPHGSSICFIHAQLHEAHP